MVYPPCPYPKLPVQGTNGIPAPHHKLLQPTGSAALPYITLLLGLTGPFIYALGGLLAQASPLGWQLLSPLPFPSFPPKARSHVRSRLSQKSNSLSTVTHGLMIHTTHLTLFIFNIKSYSDSKEHKEACGNRKIFENSGSRLS